MRSRTGCLTCRQRKLKCDEQKPICGQCNKANRQCQPSSGLTFRHQHNASMNASEDGSWSERNPPLKAFYSYKNTFDANTVWLDVPKQLTFFNTTNPYLDPGTPDPDGQVPSPYPAQYAQQQGQWNTDNQLQDQHLNLAPELHPHGLEALSAAALYHPPEANMIPRSLSSHHHPEQYDSPFDSSPARHHEHHHTSPTANMSSSNNLNFLLNPTSTIDSPIDPSLMSPATNHPTPPSRATNLQNTTNEKHLTGEAESEHKVAFLLRHFSESPGQWMDLFDLGNYFGSYVPVQARSHLLLRHAACAYAAKQLGRAKGAKAVVGGICSKQASMEIYEDPSIDWEWEGAYHYDKSIAILMDTMQQEQSSSRPVSHDDIEPLWEASISTQSRDAGLSLHSGRSVVQLRSEEVVAAAAILCVYEFLSATGAAWSRHLNGTKSLLDIAEGNMMPLEMPSFESFFIPQRRGPSKARRATFWNFARQDYIAAFINECQTRLDTDNLQLWKEAGLALSDDGLVIPSNMTESGLPKDAMMKEDMISNALVWLSSRLCNFIAAGEGFDPVPAGDRSETPRDDVPGEFGKSQKSLLDKWRGFRHEFDVWFEGLPMTFKPSARIKSNIQRPFTDVQIFSPAKTSEYPFDEVWYSIPMCGATMMHYHMARILLLINKPHESTARRSTIGGRLKSYREIEEEIVHHCYEICGIASSRPPATVRIHMTQPLYVAGQCLTHHRERRVILDLLRGIESDLGWATQYRVQQLEKDWEWVIETDVVSVDG